MFLRFVTTALVGCMGLLLVSAPSFAQDTSETALTLAITDGTLPKALRLIKARKGDKLRWRISSNTAGTLHVHAYRIEASLSAGQSTALTFDAFATGRFRLEWHGAQDKGGASPGHHAPPLGILEVLPH